MSQAGIIAQVAAGPDCPLLADFSPTSRPPRRNLAGIMRRFCGGALSTRPVFVRFTRWINGQHQHPYRRRALRTALRPRSTAASRRCRRPARRRLHRSLHRPLPQRGHRQPRRYPVAHAGRAPALPARTGRTPRRDPRQHRGTGQADPELARDIKLADTKTRLEDLYLPYKQKRRTKGQIALEAGLGALADALFDDPTLVPESEAARFVDAEKASPTSRRCWKAPSTSSWSASPKTPRCSTSCACS